jgi:gas vesicle protein
MKIERMLTGLFAIAMVGALTVLPATSLQAQDRKAKKDSVALEKSRKEMHKDGKAALKNLKEGDSEQAKEDYQEFKKDKKEMKANKKKVKADKIDAKKNDNG